MISMKKIIITILTLALIITAFASCTKTETETTTYEPVIEFSTEEITSEEVTTETPTTMQEETTTEVPSTEEVTTEAPATEVPTTQAPETTTKAPETTTKAPETTTKVPEVETTTKKEEVTTEEEINNSNNDSNLDFVSMSGHSPERIGLIYDSNGNRTTYDKLAEGEIYFAYDEDGYRIVKQKPYSPGNEPIIDRDHCPDCGKKVQAYNGEHYGCYYGYCSKFMKNMNCPECGEYVKAMTCHTCKK